jgi:hypothetical protein
MREETIFVTVFCEKYMVVFVTLLMKSVPFEWAGKLSEQQVFKQIYLGQSPVVLLYDQKICVCCAVTAKLIVGT